MYQIEMISKKHVSKKNKVEKKLYACKGTPHFLNVTFHASTFKLIYSCISFFLFKTLFIFRERGREGEREGEKQQCVVASCSLPTGDLTCNAGMCPDWESNW